MAKRRKVGNLLALAVLATVTRRPMHPYEMASLLRAHGKEDDMEIKWGSLCTVVRNLAKHGFLAVVENTREGARPERTVYRIADAGRAELVDWARELVSTPLPERSAFKAGLSVLSVLQPEEAAAMLRRRLDALERANAAARESLARHARRGPRRAGGVGSSRRRGCRSGRQLRSDRCEVIDDHPHRQAGVPVRARQRGQGAMRSDPPERSQGQAPSRLRREPRQQGQSGAASDEFGDELVVLDPDESPERFTVGPLDGEEDGVEGIALRDADPCGSAQKIRGQMFVRAERVLGGERDIDRLVREHTTDQPVAPGGELGREAVRDDDVEVQRARGVVGLGEIEVIQVELDVAGAQAPDQRRQQGRARRGKPADSDAPPGLPSGRLQAGAYVGQDRAHLVGAGGEDLTLRGQPQAAADPFDELHAQLALCGPKLLGQR